MRELTAEEGWGVAYRDPPASETATETEAEGPGVAVTLTLARGSQVLTAVTIEPVLMGCSNVRSGMP